MERAYAGTLPALQTPSAAFIVALTGLASKRDQKKAFDAGVDLYVKKPASFKQVGRLMRSWEANGEGRASDGLPHGALTGEDVLMAPSG